MPPELMQQLELEAEAELELEQEQAALSRGTGGMGFAKPDAPLGPQYADSYGSNFLQGIYDAPEAMLNMAGDVFQTVTPYDPFTSRESGWQIPVVDPIRRAGAETSLRTGGSLASGTAGAAALAPWAAGWGSVLGPWGTVGGGILGGAAGFAGGVLGFDLTTDAATGQLGTKSNEDYFKDAAYNFGQGIPMLGAGELARRVPGVRQFANTDQTGKVVDTLQQLDPTLNPASIDAAYAREAALGTPQSFIDQRSLGELLNSDVLKNSQRTLQGAGPESFGKSVEARNLRNDTQLKYLNEIETSPANMADVQASIQQGLDNQVLGASRNIGAAETAVADAMSKVPSSIEAGEAGGMIREALQNAKDVQKGKVTEAFNAAGDGVIDPTPAQLVAAELLPKYFKDVGDQPNAELLRLVEDLNRAPEPTGLLDAKGAPIVKPVAYTLREIQALRSKALDIANGSDQRTASVAGQIAEGLKKAGDDAVKLGTIAPEEIANWKKGIDLRKEQGTLFESSATPAKTVLAKQPYGEFKVPESAIPQKYFRTGNKGVKEGLQNYKQTIGNTEAALEPIHRYAAESFKNYAVKGDGTVDARKANNWLRDHGAALEELPGLRDMLSNVHKAQQFLNEKFGDLKKTEADVQKGALSYILKVDPEAAIGAMLSGKDMIKRTVSTVQHLKAKDPDAVLGLRRGVLEHIQKKGYVSDGAVGLEEARLPGGEQFSGTVKDGILKSEWERIQPALERSKLFTDSQMKALDYWYKDKASQLSVSKARIPGQSNTVQDASTLAYFVKAARGAFLKQVFLPGVPGAKYIASVLEPILRNTSEAKFQALFEEAILNPRIARDLMNKATAKNVTKMGQALFADDIKSALGGTALLSQETQTEPQPLPKPKPAPRPQAITAQQTFPDPKKVLDPPAPGMLKKTSFDVSTLQPETRARISAESAGNPWAISKKGARGLNQLMDATAEEIAGKLGEVYMPLRPGMTPEEERASIDQNVRFGEYYYSQQLKKYKSPTLARAAYNAGPGRVDEAIAMAGSSRDVNKVLANLPKGVQKETIPYVQKIAARYGNV